MILTLRQGVEIVAGSSCLFIVIISAKFLVHSQVEDSIVDIGFYVAAVAEI
jgi:hypothetical protein